MIIRHGGVALTRAGRTLKRDAVLAVDSLGAIEMSTVRFHNPSKSCQDPFRGRATDSFSAAFKVMRVFG
jgi:DNA-binding transcriptional LysR family regulator